MNITKSSTIVRPGRFSRYRYNILSALGKDGSRLTGSEEHIALSRRASQEGMVLLENNGYLPLAQGTTVALFGIGSLEYIKGGGGSGQVYPAYIRNLYEGFIEKAPRVKVYEPLSTFYYEYAAPRVEQLVAREVLSEPEIPAALMEDAVQNADAAIISIHRYSSEAYDRLAEKGDFYLTDQEEKLVQEVTNRFPHTVVVLNVGGMVDVSWARNNPRIDAVLLAWQAGMEGCCAVADILCGDVNPSGRLTDTFAEKFSDYPHADSFNESRDYLEYREDIYVGYRYFETIPGAAGKVVYPFGYGLSYTTFQFSTPEANQEGDEIAIRLRVKNTGAMAGKEVVQVYFSAPQGVLGKSAISLAAFQKTRLLAPGEEQDICLRFPIADMASYDDLGKLQKSAYVLEQGEYRFFVGNNCRDLQECSFRYTVTDGFKVTRQLTQYLSPVDLRKRLLADGSYEALPESTIPEFEPPVYPTEQKQPPEERIFFASVAAGEADLDTFVSQMTEGELIGMVGGIPQRGLSNTAGWGGVDRLGIPAVMTIDGPAGVRLHPGTGVATTAWPCATLVACTWNTQIAYEIGVAGGMECKENALAIWLTPALNIHRNPLCGRNFEYYSEDPLISGKFAAATVQGIQSTGTSACPKHFAANNKETNRFYCDSRLSERALREIYLRGFEICVKESDPRCLMTSYNLINRRRACESYELIRDILRGEWGYRGMVTTDWNVPCDQVWCILAGNDVRMRTGFPEALQKALDDGRLHRADLEACAKRILNMILTLD